MNFKIAARLLVLVIIVAYKPVDTSHPGLTGLYLTPDDFSKHKITYSSPRPDGKNKLKLNEFFGSSKGYIVYMGEKHSFDKNKIFGYQGCENISYRFFHAASYRILDTAGFYLYYRYEQEEHLKGKELVKKDNYFFSKNALAPIEPLTIENLKNVFPGDHRFHYLLDQQFRRDDELMAYDSYGKMYKVKYVYRLSQK
jgi:hypothetical protein